MSRRSPSATTGTLGTSGGGIGGSGLPTTSSVLGPRAPPLPRRRAPNLYIANPDSDEEEERDRQRSRKVSGGDGPIVGGDSGHPSGHAQIGQGQGQGGTLSQHTSPRLAQASLTFGHVVPNTAKPPLRVITQPPTPGIEGIPKRFSPDPNPLPNSGSNLSPLSQPPPHHPHPHQTSHQSSGIPPPRAQPPALPTRSTWSPTEHLSPGETDYAPSALAYTQTIQPTTLSFRAPEGVMPSHPPSIPKPSLARRAETSPISAGASLSASTSHASSALPTMTTTVSSLGVGSLPPGAEPPRAGSTPNALAAKIRQERAFSSDRDRSNLPKITTPPTIPLPPPPSGAIPVSLVRDAMIPPVRPHGIVPSSGFASRTAPHTIYPNFVGPKPTSPPIPHLAHSQPQIQTQAHTQPAETSAGTGQSPSSPSSRQYLFSASSTASSGIPAGVSVHPSRSSSQPAYPQQYSGQGQSNRHHALPAVPSHPAPQHGKSQQGQAVVTPGTRSQTLGNVRLAVTTDGESFSVVDVSGVDSAEAIVERVYAKLRFCDDDHPTLAMFRTDIGEQPDANAIGMKALFELCLKEGDSKGGLKFLVVQNALPLTPSSSVVPPPMPQTAGTAHQDDMYYLSSPAQESRETFSQSSQSNAGQPTGHGQTGRPRDSRHSHSKEGSLSSASDLWGRSDQIPPAPSPGHGSGLDDGPFETSPTDPNPNPGQHPVWREKETGSGGLVRQHKITSQRQRLPSSSTSRSSRSPVDNRYARNRPFATPYETSGSSSITSVSTGEPSRSKGRPLEPNPGEATPTYPAHPNMRGGNSLPVFLPSSPAEIVQQGNTAASGSKHPSDALPHEYRWQRSPSEPTEADLAMIAKLEKEEQEKDQEQQRQLQEDAKVAMLEQQKEQAAWEQAREVERESRQRQVEEDRRAAEQSLVQERELNAARARREAERAERERERQVGRERKERRMQWEQRNQIARVRGDGTLSSITPAWPTYGGPESGIAGVGAGRSTLEPLFVTTGDPNEVPTDGTLTASNVSAINKALGTRDGSGRSRHAGILGENENNSRRLIAEPDTVERQLERPSYSSAQPSYDRPAVQPSISAPYGGEASGQMFAQPESVLRWQQGVSASDPRESSSGHFDRASPKSALHSPPFNNTRSMDNMQNKRNEDLDIISPMGGVPIYRPSPEFSRSFGRTAGSPYASAYESSALEEIYQDDVPPARRAPPMRRSNSGQPSSQSLDVTMAQVPATIERSDIDFPVPVPFSADRRGSESAMHGVTHSQSPSLSRRASLGARDGSEFRTVVVSPALISSHDQLYGTNLGIPDRDDVAEERSSSLNSGRTVQPASSGKNGGLDSEDNSGDTAKAGNWAKSLQDLLETSNGETLMLTKPTLGQAEEYQPEETLFFVPPSAGISLDEGTLTLSKPKLQVDTASQVYPISAQQASSVDRSDPPASVTDSEDADGSISDVTPSVKRNKSFAKTRDQWNFRPPAEDVYDNLEEFFPKIDLDKPVVEAPAMIDPTSPRSESPMSALPDHSMLEPPRSRSRFNKAENRKSIRVVAEGRKKHLSRIAPAIKPQLSAAGALERKRSSSMWDHKVIEVTPAKLKAGQNLGGSADGGPLTMTWVKGDLIGKGTYGRVYLALNATTGDMIAVKQVEMPRTESDREDARQSGMIDALKSEIALLKDLDHPNVVSYLGWEESPRYLSIFLEYVPGGSVASVYRKHKKFEEAVIKSFTKQILGGLAYLHSLHILHRDLKADNILVDPSGVCKITDFGISKRADDAYNSIISTNLKGSVFWMAPEVVHSVKGQGYSAKVDIWSLGCCVLEMWAGRRPWGDMEALAAMFQLANARSAPPVPDDVSLSAAADDFLNKRCFASSPRDRPTAVDLLEHPFITEVDPAWTFAESGIGKAVAAGSKRR